MIRMGAVYVLIQEARQRLKTLIPLLLAAQCFSLPPLHCFCLICGWHMLLEQWSSYCERRAAAVVVERIETHNQTNSNVRMEGGVDILTQLPDPLLASIVSYLHPREVTKLASVHRSCFSSNAIWKTLWYRDYGNVLLEWQVGRAALTRSLHRRNIGKGFCSLELLLSERLEEIGRSLPIKDFYFLFGEIYLNYLLAGHNNVHKQDCYLGLHGHVYDFAPFAPYHPGLIEPILLDCGADATSAFEDVRHSSGARAIVRRLVVVIHLGIVGDPHRFGLLLRQQKDNPNLQNELSRSNSRPLLRAAYQYEEEEKEWSHPLIPRNPRKRRPPTLARIRKQWDDRISPDSNGVDEKDPSAQPSWWISKEPHLRYYYDPFRQKWIQWNAAKTLKC